MRASRGYIAELIEIAFLICLIASCNQLSKTPTELPDTWPDQSITIIDGGKICRYEEVPASPDAPNPVEMWIVEVETDKTWQEINGYYTELMAAQSAYAKVTDEEGRQLAQLVFMAENPRRSVSITHVFPSNVYSMTYRRNLSK